MFHSYTKTSSVASHTLTNSEMPQHGHSVQFANKDATKTIFADFNGSGSTSWTISGLGASNNVSNPLTAIANGSSASHTHGINTTSSSTTSTGSGTAVSIVQSYYTVYTWTRTV